MAGQPGFIYLLQLHEHAHNNIYKVGRTHDLSKRLSGYPKHSALVLSFQVSDALNAERTILSQLRSACVQRTDIGTEYFEGALDEIIRVINQNMCRYLPTHLLVMQKRLPSNCDEVENLWVTCSCEEVIEKFMTIHRDQYVTSAIPLHVLVDEIRRFAIKQKLRCNTLTEMNIELKLKEKEGCSVGDRRCVGSRVVEFPGHVPAPIEPLEQEVYSTISIKRPARPKPVEPDVDQFIAECCNVEKGFRCSSVDLLRVYNSWLEQTYSIRSGGVSAIHLYLLMEEKGFRKKKAKYNRLVTPCYFGIRIRPGILQDQTS
jgi:hypothetical protein